MVLCEQRSSGNPRVRLISRHAAKARHYVLHAMLGRRLHCAEQTDNFSLNFLSKIYRATRRTFRTASSLNCRLRTATGTGGRKAGVVCVTARPFEQLSAWPRCTTTSHTFKTCRQLPLYLCLRESREHLVPQTGAQMGRLLLAQDHLWL